MSDATLPLHHRSAHTPPGGLGEGGVYKTLSMMASFLWDGPSGLELLIGRASRTEGPVSGRMSACVASLVVWRP